MSLFRLTRSFGSTRLDLNQILPGFGIALAFGYMLYQHHSNVSCKVALQTSLDRALLSNDLLSSTLSTTQGQLDATASKLADVERYAQLANARVKTLARQLIARTLLAEGRRRLLVHALRVNARKIAAMRSAQQDLSRNWKQARSSGKLSAASANRFQALAEEATKAKVEVPVKQAQGQPLSAFVPPPSMRVFQPPPNSGEISTDKAPIAVDLAIEAHKRFRRFENASLQPNEQLSEAYICAEANYWKAKHRVPTAWLDIVYPDGVMAFISQASAPKPRSARPAMLKNVKHEGGHSHHMAGQCPTAKLSDVASSTIRKGKAKSAAPPQVPQPAVIVPAPPVVSLKEIQEAQAHEQALKDKGCLEESITSSQLKSYADKANRVQPLGEFSNKMEH